VWRFGLEWCGEGRGEKWLGSEGIGARKEGMCGKG
jgi:hypothetical protein